MTIYPFREGIYLNWIRARISIINLHTMTDKNMDDICPSLLCPICQRIMSDPVITEHGMLYDRKCILGWMDKKDNQTDPLTRKVFVTKKLQTIPLFREIIREIKPLIPPEDIKISLSRLSCEKEELYDQARELEKKGNYLEAYPFYREAMIKGSLDGQVKVAWYYLFGMSTVKIDYSKAFSLLTTVNDLLPDHEEAWLWLGHCYEFGKGVDRHPLRALDALKKAVKSGKSLFIQAVIHHSQEKDFDKKARSLYEEALPLLLKEADSDPVSQFFLGLFYRHGCSQKKDDEKAFSCFLSSAEKGMAEAQHNLAVFFHDGKGTETDITKAIIYYQRAADQGHGTALAILGWLINSQEYIQQAALSHDNRVGYHLMGVNCEESENNEQMAIQYYMKAAAKGFKKSEERLEALMRKRIRKEMEGQEKARKREETSSCSIS
jgi:TPR repeat protein